MPLRATVRSTPTQRRARARCAICMLRESRFASMVPSPRTWFCGRTPAVGRTAVSYWRTDRTGRDCTAAWSWGGYLAAERSDLVECLDFPGFRGAHGESVLQSFGKGPR